MSDLGKTETMNGNDIYDFKEDLPLSCNREFPRKVDSRTFYVSSCPKLDRKRSFKTKKPKWKINRQNRVEEKGNTKYKSTNQGSRVIDEYIQKYDQAQNKVYYIAKQSQDLSIPSLPKITLKTLHNYSEMPAAKRTKTPFISSTKMRKFAKIKRKVEKQLQVQLNRKTWHTDKFSLIKARRNGSSKPQGLYVTTKRRRRKPLEDQKSNLTQCSSSQSTFSHSQSNTSYLRVDLNTLGSTKDYEKTLKNLYPDIFTKYPRIELFRHKNPLHSPCKKCSPLKTLHSLSKSSKAVSEIKVTKEHLHKLKMKILPGLCKKTYSEPSVTLKDHEMNSKEEFVMKENSPPPVLEMKGLFDKKVSKAQKDLPSPQPPVLELEDETEPYVYVERDDEYFDEICDEDHQGNEFQDKCKSLSTKVVTLPNDLQEGTEDEIGSCTTLEVFVYQEHPDIVDERSEISDCVLDTSVILKKESIEIDNQEIPTGTLPNVFGHPQNDEHSNQALPDVNGHAQMERNKVDMTGTGGVSEDGYDSDATVAYSEGDDEESFTTKLCKPDTQTNVKSPPNGCSALKIKRTDQLYKFKGSLLRKVSSDSASKQIDAVGDSVFKIPSSRPVRNTRVCPSSSSELKDSTTNKSESNDTDPPKIAKECKVTNEKRSNKSVRKEESLTLTIFKKPKSMKDLKALQRKTAIKYEVSDFGKLISQPDKDSIRNQVCRKSKRTRTPKHRNGIITSINRVFPNGRQYKPKNDEDELPKLLPPKRRRLIKDQGQSLPVQNGMERLIQEFPRHNWLENKYMQEDNKEGNFSIESNPAVSGARIISIETLSMLEESAPFTQSSNDATVLETNTIQHSAGIMNDTPQCQTNNDDDVVYGDDKSRHCSKNDSIEEMSAHSNDVNSATVDESLPISRAGSLYDDEYRNNHPEGTTSEQISKGVTEIVPGNAKNFMSTSESNDVSLLSTKQMDIESNTPAQIVEENQTEIRSVELDSDVGTVISISEKTENDQRITDMNQRENLPPIPRLIHATTLEAFGSLNDVSKSLSNDDENGLHDKDKCVAKGDQIENLPCEALQSHPNVSILIAQNAHLQEHSDESINAESNQSRDLSDMDNSSAFSTGAGSLEDKYVNEKKFQNETRVEVSKASIPHKHQVAKLSKLVDSNPSKWVITTLSNDCIVQEAAMNLNVQSKDTSSCLPSVNTLQKADCLKQQASSYHDIPQPQLVEAYITRTTSMQINGNDVVQLNERHNHVTNKKTRQKGAEQKQFEEALRYEKLLQEYKTVEKMTELKEQERDRLLCLKDKMLKELNFMRTKTYQNDTPSSGAEINLKKTELHMQCPPPAHQPKKENVIEILEKMEQEASAIPADIRNSCPFRIRNTPLLNAPYDITIDPREKASLNQAVSAAHCANNKSNLFQMQGHFDTYNASKVCNNVTRSSSAPSQGCTKTPKTGVFSFQPPGQIPLGQGNAILISDKGKKRSSSEEIVNLRHTGEPERYMQFAGNERKIQEELKTAVAIKRQRMDAVNITTKHEMPANTFNNVDKVIPQNVSIAPQYRRIAPNNHNAATEFNQQKGNVNWQHLNLTKELLRKPNPVPTQHGFQRYPGQVQNGVRMSRGHLMHQVPRQQQLRPQTVRLLGATTMPQTQKHIQGHYQVQQPTISPYHVDHHKQDVNQSDQSSLMTASMDVRNPYNAFQAVPAVTYQKQNGVNRHTIQNMAPTTTQVLPPSSHQAMKTQQNHSAPPQNTAIHTMNTVITQSQIISAQPSVQTNGCSKHNETPESFKTQVTRINGTCIMCNKFALYLCSSCQKYWYCSPDCQLKHWLTHQNDCSADKRNG